MTVLVLSEDCDPTVDRVVEALAARNVPVFRCDTGWFPGSLWLDAELDTHGWAGTLATEHREVRLHELRSIWSRRPTTFTFPADMSEPERQHAAWEAKFGVGGVLASLPVRWVNPPSGDADCSYKPRQLAVAHRCGLRVPATLVTNRSAAARRFAGRHDHDTVIKPMSYASINEQGGTRPIYTYRLTASDLADLRGVDATAHLFQRFISDKVFEARVTVVDDRVFACAIHAGSAQSHVDWRSDYQSLAYSVIDVPDDVVARLRAFMAAFGLMFGAFDFAIDRAGTWWWFECNSSGQFLFIEAQTGLPITDALADLLAKGQP